MAPSPTLSPRLRLSWLSTAVILTLLLWLPAILFSCRPREHPRARAAKLAARAQELMFADKPAEAVKLFDQAKALNPTSSFATHGSVWARLALGQFDAALVHADEAIRRFPGRYESFEDRADALAGLKRWDEAIESYEKCISLDPGGYWTPWMKLAAAQKTIGDIAGARGTYEDLLNRFPGHAEARRMLEGL